MLELGRLVKFRLEVGIEGRKKKREREVGKVFLEENVGFVFNFDVRFCFNKIF